MFRQIQIILFIFISLNISNSILADDKFFEQGKQKYEEKKYDVSKFLFQRSILFDPKDTKSYLYLAKIYNFEKNKKEEEKNINTVLLLEPKNEEAILMLMKIELNKSNYSKVKKLSKNFLKVCINLCKKNESIIETLINLEPKNES
jgi:hypothetical protein